MHICKGNTNKLVILHTLMVQTGFLTWLCHGIWDLDLMSSLILRSFEWPTENTNYVKRAWFTRRLTHESVPWSQLFAQASVLYLYIESNKHCGNCFFLFFFFFLSSCDFFFIYSCAHKYTYPLQNMQNVHNFYKRGIMKIAFF